MTVAPRDELGDLVALERRPELVELAELVGGDEAQDHGAAERVPLDRLRRAGGDPVGPAEGVEEDQRLARRDLRVDLDRELHPLLARTEHVGAAREGGQQERQERQ